ncbi:tRNA1(Val) (adenine(37)-N6)-methyltransferase [Flagellimonas lutaonensis]|uniref:tRNA1(Val) (adenine(37)-N6)-methyltransferase n=1 Tax=Flagellimonas lutaonensis TaxID=516051 RepID=A0A0D5YTU8_9FLAO|nr:methyltransferase [Allomuricauda lutaonensis]AKA35319.1 tRNA1(Val) (adenine(37)-N6)-methyltransferase [Allomuricauda lutaonensis]
MGKPFKFKQFTINQDRCAMKVGTDGVLLGAWTGLENNPGTILDVGAGTGLIALQLAQRSTAETIDAVELDDNAFEQCVENFEASPWPDRLFCYHASFQEFVEEIDDTYDLIVSNPPFYSENVSSGNTSRDLARQNQSLPFNDLIVGVSKLLSGRGSFATIIPHEKEASFVEMAAENNLYSSRVTKVKGHPDSNFKRSLLQFSRIESIPSIDELTIEISRHRYTPEFISLTKDFYLKM